MIPDNSLSSELVFAEYLYPDTIERHSLLEDYEMGGVAISDPSQGMRVQKWTIYKDIEGDVWVRPELYGSPELVYSPAGQVTELALAFDQNMNVFVAFVMDGNAGYYWYDPIEQGYEAVDLGNLNYSPRCSLDDKRESMVDSSDIILAYMRGTALYYREERDRYTVEYLLNDFGEGNIPGVFLTLGMTKVNRLQIMFRALVDTDYPVPPVPPKNLYANPLIEFSIDAQWSAISPPVTDGLITHLDGREPGDVVNQWSDQSGQDNHWTAISASQMPVQQGDDSMLFDGSDVIYGPNAYNGLAAAEIFVRLRSSANSGLWYFSNEGDNGCWYTYSSNTAAYVGWGHTERKSWQTGVDVTNFHTLNIHTAPGDWAAKVNGVTRVTDTSVTVNFVTAPYIGRMQAATYYLSGAIKALLIFNRKLSSEERTLMNDWMGDL